jgi:hypothetical protein
MKILQNQLWKKDDAYYRVVHRDRLSVVYKTLKDPGAKGGEQKNATKKEFCRMLKGAVLLPETPRTAGESPLEDADEADFSPEL